MGFWPSPVDEPVRGALDAFLDYLWRLGVPSWFDYNLVEATGNVLLFVPLGILAVMSFRGGRWWQFSGTGFLASVVLECGQWLLLTNRFPSVADVIANTVGTTIGVGLVALLHRR
ncbi:VanZ family protein [Arthrobacter sp. 1088]|uniref:VanZ family protein n=1 Tax=Arthrobacter sp. 1088 TaxID=2817768 RepID=UPI0037C00AF9